MGSKVYYFFYYILYYILNILGEDEEDDKKKRNWGVTSFYDPVKLYETDILVPGSTEAQVKFKDQIYCFQDNENREVFLANPMKYIDTSKLGLNGHVILYLKVFSFSCFWIYLTSNPNRRDLFKLPLSGSVASVRELLENRRK